MHVVAAITTNITVTRDCENYTTKSDTFCKVSEAKWSRLFVKMTSFLASRVLISLPGTVAHQEQSQKPTSW